MYCCFLKFSPRFFFFSFERPKSYFDFLKRADERIHNLYTRDQVPSRPATNGRMAWPPSTGWLADRGRLRAVEVPESAVIGRRLSQTVRGEPFHGARDGHGAAHGPAVPAVAARPGRAEALQCPLRPQGAAAGGDRVLEEPIGVRRAGLPDPGPNGEAPAH